MALLGLLAVAVMVFAYVLTSRLNAASQFVGIDRDHNAKVMAQAKRALIGYVAQQATASGEHNPGHFPCPEAPANYGTANEGIEASYCSAQAIGRLPWRTLGVEKLVDAAGEPLWYAVSNGWHRPNSSDTLTINSDSQGQLSFEGTTPVALIFAPGAAIAAQAGTGCAAWTQSRPVSGPPDPRNYLECENATSPADATFVASRAGEAFNDQVVPVMAGDVIPALEAAIAERVQREIAPALKAVYTSTGYSGIPSSSPMYPYAAPFTDPGTSDYQGSAGTYKGLLPVNQASTMVAYDATPGNAVETLGYGTIDSQTCFWETADEVRVCEGIYKESSSEPWQPIQIEMSARFTNVAMGLRAIDATRYQVYARDDGGSPPWAPVTASHEATMHTDGSVTVRFWATMPNIDDMGWNTRAEFRFRIERAVIADHFLLNTDPNPATNPAGAATSWFVRNEWYRMTYYATVRRNTAIELSNLGCSTDSSDPSDQRCLRFNDSGVYNIRALLVLAGRSLNDPTGRPNGDLRDYVEWQNCDHDPDSWDVTDPCIPKTLFEQRLMRTAGPPSQALNAPFNDRVILVDWSGSLNANQIATASPLRTVTLP